MNAGSTAPAAPDSSLRTVVPSLFAWLLAGIPREVAVLDDIEALARRVVLELQGRRPGGLGRRLVGSLALLVLDTTRRRGPLAAELLFHEPRVRDGLGVPGESSVCFTSATTMTWPQAASARIEAHARAPRVPLHARKALPADRAHASVVSTRPRPTPRETTCAGAQSNTRPRYSINGSSNAGWDRYPTYPSGRTRNKHSLPAPYRRCAAPCGS